MFRCVFSLARATNPIISCLANPITSSTAVNSVIVPQQNYSLALSSSTEPTFDYRRLRRKSQWKDVLNTTGPDAPDVYPSDQILTDRLGSEILLNWTFNYHKVTPIYEAYRNLHLRGLTMLSPAIRDKENRIIDETDYVPYEYVQNFVANSENELPEGVKSLTTAQSGRAVREVRKALSSDSPIFMHDGTVGGVKVRVITDNPTAAIFLHNIMTKARLQSPADFKPDTVAYISDKVDFTDLADYGITQPFSILDPQLNRVVIGGSTCPETIKSSLADISAHFQFLQGDLPLPDSFVSQNQQNNTSIIFADSDIISDIAASKNNLAGAHDNTWTSEGISGNWNGFTTENSQNIQLNEGALIQRGETSKSEIVTAQTATNNTANPNSLIFVVKLNENESKTAKTFKLSNEQATEFFLRHKGYRLATLEENEIAKRFHEKLQETKVPAYFVIAPANAVVEHIDNIFSGKVKAANMDSFKADDFKQNKQAKGSEETAAKKAPKTKRRANKKK